SGSDITAETRTLKIDSTKLNEAFDKNFDSVFKLLTNGESGIVDKLLKRVDNALDSSSGYFTTKSDTISKQIKNADQSLARATTNLEAYRVQLTNQFNRMDALIAKLNQQYASFGF
ncbi:flagellar hook-associated 2 domain protein, partial [Candidatus Gastranaerophilus sp. (ex Termes propinquus)]